MAVDGVAPRAKMNQQRGRRFRSAREAKDLIAKAVKNGEVLPTEERFDSNCITPGTPFMARLHEHLKYFVVQKLTTDKLWQGVKVYYSGHETPGEGEHKVMEFIRYQRSQPDYDPDTRHCLYGLDADLIMLGLTSHEPHFSLLREEIKFGSKHAKKRSVTPAEITFHLLHLSLMREYIEFEFQPVKEKLPFEFDIEKVLDDWVLLGFLVGNDFIPHLPDLHIHTDSLPYLWRTYCDTLPTLGGYINNNGHLNLARFEKFLRKLSQFDVNNFSEKMGDAKYMAGKTGGGPKRAPRSNASLGTQATGILTANQFFALRNGSNGAEGGLQGMFGDDDGGDTNDEDLMTSDSGVAALASGVLGDDEEDSSTGREDEETDSDDKLFHREFTSHKASYYMDKMAYKNVTSEVLRDQALGYVRAIQWILHYYYSGVPSWSWYFPHHYAPYLSDVKDFANESVTFDLSRPFLPFQQLMAVLPSASSKLLPEAYQTLMMERSPISDFYPMNFATDLNGKQQDWEAVVLIPFIEEERLLAAMKAQDTLLTADERRRNTHGPHLLFEYTEKSQGIYNSPLIGHFPNIIDHHAQCTPIPSENFFVDDAHMLRGLCPQVKLDVYSPGFPTFRHLTHKVKLTKDGVRVFNMASRNDSIIVTLTDVAETELTDAVIDSVMGKSVLANWPYLCEAKVVGLSTRTTRCDLVPTENDEVKVTRTALTPAEQQTWDGDSTAISMMYRSRRGVDIGTTSVMVHACYIVGKRYLCEADGRVRQVKEWAQTSQPFPLQTIIKEFQTVKRPLDFVDSVTGLFATGSVVFMLGQPNYGCQGKVLSVLVDEKTGTQIDADFFLPMELELKKAKNLQSRIVRQKYLPGYVVAQHLGITGHLLSRITGTIYVNRTHKDRDGGKVNIALNLKFNKTNKEVPGFSKRTEDGDWLYSMSVAEVITTYFERFPRLLDAVSRRLDNDMFHEEDLFPKTGSESLKDVVKFLDNVACAKLEPVTCGTALVESEVIDLLLQEAQRLKVAKPKKVHMKVKPTLLFQPGAVEGSTLPDPSVTFDLMDRVVCCRESYSVPLGLHGTVVGILGGNENEATTYEVLFDEEFLGGVNIRFSSLRCGYRLHSNALINLTHGERVKTGTPGVPAPRAPIPVRPPVKATAQASAGTQQQAWARNKTPRQTQQNAEGKSNANNSSKRGPEAPPGGGKPVRLLKKGEDNSPVKGAAKDYELGQGKVVYNSNVATSAAPQAVTEGNSDFNKFWADLMAGAKLPQHGAMGGQAPSSAGAHPVAPAHPPVTLASHPPVSLASHPPATQASHPSVSQHQPAQLSADEVTRAKLLQMLHINPVEQTGVQAPVPTSQSAPANVFPPAPNAIPQHQQLTWQQQAMLAPQQVRRPTVDLEHACVQQGQGLPTYQTAYQPNGRVIATVSLTNGLQQCGAPKMSADEARESAAAFMLRCLKTIPNPVPPQVPVRPDHMTMVPPQLAYHPQQIPFLPPLMYGHPAMYYMGGPYVMPGQFMVPAMVPPPHIPPQQLSPVYMHPAGLPHGAAAGMPSATVDPIVADKLRALQFHGNVRLMTMPNSTGGEGHVHTTAPAGASPALRDPLSVLMGGLRVTDDDARSDRATCDSMSTRTLSPQMSSSSEVNTNNVQLADTRSASSSLHESRTLSSTDLPRPPSDHTSSGGHDTRTLSGCDVVVSSSSSDAVSSASDTVASSSVLSLTNASQTSVTPASADTAGNVTVACTSVTVNNAGNLLLTASVTSSGKEPSPGKKTRSSRLAVQFRPSP